LASAVPTTVVTVLVVVPPLLMLVVALSLTPVMTGAAATRSGLTTWSLAVPSLPTASTTLAV
jgi:hypothetical protein